MTNTSDEASVDAQETTAVDTEETTTVAAIDPMTCLEDAGLSGVEQRDNDLWRGFHEGPFYAVIVHELRLPARARTVVREAVDVYAAQAGSYAVTGPFKAGVEGAQATAAEGAEAEALVREVAACLSR